MNYVSALDAFVIRMSPAGNDIVKLDAGTYAALAKQSVYASPSTFRAADPELFQQIVAQRLPPGPGPQTGRPNPSVSPRTEH